MSETSLEKAGRFTAYDRQFIVSLVEKIFSAIKNIDIEL